MSDKAFWRMVKSFSLLPMVACFSIILHGLWTVAWGEAVLGLLIGALMMGFYKSIDWNGNTIRKD